MKILVTGGAGFIGSNLVNHLAEATAHELVVLDDLSVGQPPPQPPNRSKFVLGDFTDAVTIGECLQGIDVVVHLAALSGVMDSIADPRPSFQINVVGTFQLLELARKAGVRQIINASTGGALLGEVTPPISEAMAPSPLSPYGASKLAVEGYCSAFAGAHGMSCATLRFSNVYGPRSAHKKSVVAAFVKQAIRGEPLVVYGDGTQQRDYLYVGDLVRGIAAVIAQGAVGTWQLGSGRPTSLHELIDALGRVAKHDLDVHFKPARRGEVKATWCDISKARRDFGFSPSTALETGLGETWRWFLENRASWPSENALSPTD